MFPFDGPQRARWHYIPQPRPGIALHSLSGTARAWLDTLLLTGLSHRGHATALGIIRHERILGELETAAGRADRRLPRDTGLYFLAVFGPPAVDSVWAWRFEGHHLSVNVTNVGVNGQVAAPLFMGANPARVPSGPHAGLRLLADEEDLARALMLSFDGAQRRRALLADTTAGDIVTRNAPHVEAFSPDGLPAAAMSGAQQAQLRRLLDVYLGRFAPDAAAQQRRRLDSAGFGGLHFAWAGSLQAGRAHYYRVHGPTLLVEYDNTQSDANHVHTVWRDLQNDFGGDLLRRHYARRRHGQGARSGR